MTELELQVSLLGLLVFLCRGNGEMIHLNLCSNKLHLLSDTALEACTASIVVNGDDKAISWPFLKTDRKQLWSRSQKKTSS